MFKGPTFIYHITHVRNLAGIVQTGGLKCNGRRREDGTDCVSIAYRSIQSRRARTHVPCGPGGTLHDYVPFYFAPRSPMLYTINRGNVEEYREGQEPVVHLVSTAQMVRDAGRPYVFTDGHGIMVPLTEFYDDLAYLDRVDWAVMKSRYWNDTVEDNDRCRRRQAEFLVHDVFPWELVLGVGVISDAMKIHVEEVLAGANHVPRIVVKPGWYY